MNKQELKKLDTRIKAIRKAAQELKELGYASRMKYNGEVVVDNIAEENVVLVKKNHKLIIHLNKKQVGEKEKGSSESNL